MKRRTKVFTTQQELDEHEAKKEYYRQYYQRKKKESIHQTNLKRGRKPKPKPPAFKIIKLETPIVLSFD
tara:strand:+ start:15242 stop:15448 length:207 start_codon:yes stop_codon:yes gene_type:complete